MIDLHTHSIFSDGELIPAELIRRASAMGYRAIAITDHMDHSNIDLIIPRIVKAVRALRDYVPIEVLAGAELTHVPPPLIADLVREARKLGAQIVVIHGETLVEPVIEGTNRAALESGADILAHPGLMTEDEFLLARDRGMTLEITARKGHSLSNGHVARWATRHGVNLTLNTDAHAPSDLITAGFGRKVLAAAGIDEPQVNHIFQHAESLVERAIRRE